MPRKKGFSPETHEESGARLKRSSRDLMDLRIQLSNEYGKRAKLTKLAEQAYSSVEILRSALDDSVCEENPELPDMQSIYYGIKHPNSANQ